MKKLMIAAAVAFAAVASQAATVAWTTDVIVDHAGTALTLGNGYSGLNQYTAVMTIYASDGTSVSSDFGAITASKDKTGYFSGKGNTSPSVDGNYYAQLVISGKAGTAYEGWTLTSATAQFYWDTLYSSNLSLNFSTGKNFTTETSKLVNSGTNYGWVNAVPEPTSGLLLLLGVAGLALRRRRA